MPPSSYINFQRFLAAKKSVDDRSINQNALRHLAKELANRSYSGHLQVVEIGAGIGTMLERLTGWQILPDVCYQAIDLDPANIKEARRLLPIWSSAMGLEMTETPSGAELSEKDGSRHIAVSFHAMDIYDWMAGQGENKSVDLLLAHAFMDLVDASRALAAMRSVVKKDGLLYLTSNFDGITILEPPLDPSLDRHILALYHDSMDKRLVNGRLSGDSKAGRHLFSRLSEQGIQLLAAGSSDWVVFPEAGRYPGDEAYFLHYIISLIETTLKDHASLEAGSFRRWISERRSQIEQGKVVLIVHQLDFLGYFS